MASKLMADTELESRQTTVLSSSQSALVKLESRQATLLQHITCLFETIRSLESEISTTQDLYQAKSARRDIGKHRCEKFAEYYAKLDEEYGSLTQNGRFAPKDSEMMADNGEGRRRRLGIHSEGGAEERLSPILIESGAKFLFKRVPPDYYEKSFDERRDLLGAASVDHLCKSIVMVNTQAHESVKDCRNRNNSKYYVVVVQYSARLNAEKVRHFIYTLNNGNIPKKRFNLRLAPEGESIRLTGFGHNAVTPFGMLTDIPVILSHAIANLKPDFFWLGGGEVDLKLGININGFIKIVNPFIVDCNC